MNTHMTTTEYASGYAARAVGEFCPHKSGSTAAKDWIEGWNDAAEDQRSSISYSAWAMSQPRITPHPATEIKVRGHADRIADLEACLRSIGVDSRYALQQCRLANASERWGDKDRLRRCMHALERIAEAVEEFSEKSEVAV